MKCIFYISKFQTNNQIPTHKNLNINQNNAKENNNKQDYELLEHYELLEKDFIKLNILSNNKNKTFNITFHIELFQHIKSYQKCVLYLDEYSLDGDILSIECKNELCLVNVLVSPIQNNSVNFDLYGKNNITNSSTNLSPNNLLDADYNLIERFKADNFELFQAKYKLNYDKIINGIDQYILKDSLKIKKNLQMLIGTLKVQIQASWVKCHFGVLDLSNKIKFMCPNNQLSTFTPQKLINSWPKVFSYFPHTSHATKYYAHYSNLIPEETELVKLNNNLELVKHTFTPKLSLGWEFNQLETEIVNFKIQNHGVNSEKTIKLNLHNVQEYITDNVQMFFSSNVGQSILDLIINALQTFVYNSIFNIELSFEIPICPILWKMEIGSTIQVKKYNCIVTNIDILYTPDRKVATITCVTTDITINNSRSKTHIVHTKINEFEYKDIIDSIQVQNTSTEQQKKITSTSTKQQITDILNNNQTKIIIKTKPLKKHHNNCTIVECAEPILLNDKLCIVN